VFCRLQSRKLKAGRQEKEKEKRKGLVSQEDAVALLREEDRYRLTALLTEKRLPQVTKNRAEDATRGTFQPLKNIARRLEARRLSRSTHRVCSARKRSS
jgi:hypothetical protein